MNKALTFLFGKIIPVKYSDDPEKEFYCGHTEKEFNKITDDKYQEYKRKSDAMTEQEHREVAERVYWNTGIDVQSYRDKWAEQDKINGSI